jgi:hypothetical protein
MAFSIVNHVIHSSLPLSSWPSPPPGVIQRQLGMGCYPLRRAKLPDSVPDPPCRQALFILRGREGTLARRTWRLQLTVGPGSLQHNWSIISPPCPAAKSSCFLLTRLIRPHGPKKETGTRAPEAKKKAVRSNLPPNLILSQRGQSFTRPYRHLKSQSSIVMLQLFPRSDV